MLVVVLYAFYLRSVSSAFSCVLSWSTQLRVVCCSCICNSSSHAVQAARSAACSAALFWSTQLRVVCVVVAHHHTLALCRALRGSTSAVRTMRAARALLRAQLHALLRAQLHAQLRARLHARLRSLDPHSFVSHVANVIVTPHTILAARSAACALPHFRWSTNSGASLCCSHSCIFACAFVDPHRLSRVCGWCGNSVQGSVCKFARTPLVITRTLPWARLRFAFSSLLLLLTHFAKVSAWVLLPLSRSWFMLKCVAYCCFSNNNNNKCNNKSTTIYTDCRWRCWSICFFPR